MWFDKVSSSNPPSLYTKLGVSVGRQQELNQVSESDFETSLRSVKLNDSYIKTLMPDQAVQFIDQILELLSSKTCLQEAIEELITALHRWPFPTNDVRILNAVFKGFAKARRLDCQLGVLHYFRNTQWDPDTWEWLLLAVTLIPESQNKYNTIGTIWKQSIRENINCTTRFDIYLNRSLRLVQSGGYILSDYGATGWLDIVHNLQWTDDSLRHLNDSYLYPIGYSQDGVVLPCAPLD